MNGNDDKDSGEMSDDIVDRMYSEDTEKPEKDKPDDVAAEVEKDEAEDTDADPDEEADADAEVEDKPGEPGIEEEVDPDVAEDYDKDPDAKDTKAKKEKPAEEEKPKTAEERAAYNGREFKKEKTAHTETKRELLRERETRERLEQELADAKRVKSDYRTDPEYQKLESKVLKAVDRRAARVRGADGSSIQKHFPSLVGQLLQAQSGDDRAAGMETLKASIREKCVPLPDGFTSYEELEGDEKRTVDNAVLDVLDILDDVSDDVDAATKLANKLQADSTEGEVLLKEREYTKVTGRFQKLIDGLGAQADDMTEANPHAIESIVAKAMKANPAMRARATAVKRDMMEFKAGPRPFSKDEIAKMKREGTDVRALERARSEKFAALEERMMSYLFYGVMTRSTVPKMAAELAQFRGKKKAVEDETDTLVNVSRGPKLGKTKLNKGEGLSASDRRRRAVADLVGGSGDDDDD